MIADIMAEYGGRLLVAIGGVGLGLICLVAVLKYLRQRNGPSPFVRGGRTRTPRLQVVDAAAVDTRRRVVLVRRDDVEHLIMIGGPTDLVIESNIVSQPAAASYTPTETAYAPAEPPAPRAIRIPEQPRPLPLEPEAEAPAPRPFIERAPVERPVPERPPAPRPAARQLPEIKERNLDAPLPITPQAAYFEASDDFTPPPAPAQHPSYPPARQPALSAPPAEPAPSSAPTAEEIALKQAEAHLEAMKRRMAAQEPSTRPRAEPEKPSGFAQVLDNEMKAPLRDTPRPVPAAIQQARRPDLPPATAPDKDPNLQDEIARIFGEKR